jgi:hypothetical protein
MESTLGVQLEDLQKAVGFFLGYGTNSAKWNAKQTEGIAESVKSGVRQFYYPPKLEGDQTAYDWSFLKPVSVMTLAVGEKLQRLPDDYGGLEGQVTLSSDAEINWWPLNVCGVASVYAKESVSPTTTGRPCMVCVEPLKDTTSRRGQRFQLHFWPTTDTEYTVKFQYYLNPDALDGTRPFCYGGAQHAETIQASCIAAAELYRDDARRERWQYFMERLAASVHIDRRNKPQNLGYNRDQSDMRNRWDGRRWIDGQSITVNGVTY